MALAAAWENMIVDWESNSVKAFLGAVASYLFGVQNWELLLILLIAIMIDTTLGMAKAIKMKEFSAKGMGKILYKVPLYSALLIMTHIAVNMIFINGGVDLSLLDGGAYLFLIIRELKGSNEKLTFFNLSFIAPIRALENMVSRNSSESKN